MAEETRCSEGILVPKIQISRTWECADYCRGQKLIAGDMFAHGRHGRYGCKYSYRWQGCDCFCYKAVKFGKCSTLKDDKYDLYVLV